MKLFQIILVLSSFLLLNNCVGITPEKVNINKIKKTLKWKPKINLKQGISILMKDTSNWKNAPLWTPNKIKKATKEWFKHLKFK